MPRKTLIFGNGLGKALNPDSFRLDNAIQTVWNDEDILSDHQKELIYSCLPEDREDFPQSEEDLDNLQLALSACDFLMEMPTSEEVHWLSDDGQQFPRAVRKLIFNTARQFHQTDEVLPEEFIDPLADFIWRTNSHIGTLNYDNLLYQPMIDREALSGYDGALVDGFHNAGFAKKNLERKFGNTFGYYLHLHGSPLFIDDKEKTKKLKQHELEQRSDVASSHIVLTHVKHKTTVISASHLLLTYWELLVEAINESNEIILFGYSGNDTHLNSLLNIMSEKPVRVVEYDREGNGIGHNEHWHSKLGDNRPIKVIPMEDILEFQDWDGDWD